jgi:hypothetical protein
MRRKGKSYDSAHWPERRLRTGGVVAGTLAVALATSAALSDSAGDAALAVVGAVLSALLAWGMFETRHAYRVLRRALEPGEHVQGTCMGKVIESHGVPHSHSYLVGATERRLLGVGGGVRASVHWEIPYGALREFGIDPDGSSRSPHVRLDGDAASIVMSCPAGNDLAAFLTAIEAAAAPGATPEDAS